MDLCRCSEECLKLCGEICNCSSVLAGKQALQAVRGRVCQTRAAWISALIPLSPSYIYVTRKWKKQGKIAM